MLTEARHYYKPFEYPWAFEAYKTQQQFHWSPEEVPLADDIKDFRNVLTEGQRKLISRLFRFFTQADSDVAGGYCGLLLPTFKPPEIRMMLSSFAAMEAVHQDAYSLILETLGFPDDEYTKFMEHKEMLEKHEYLQNFKVDSPEEIARTLAVYSGFTEGVQLFGTFAVLLNFPRHNLMKNKGQIISWSVRDESLHVQSNSKLFRTHIQENPHIWKDDLKYEIYSACEKVVQLERAFIDLCFEDVKIPGITPEEVKAYVDFIADRRLGGLGMKKIFGSKENPLPWIDYMMGGLEHVNFFENRGVEYAKASSTGSWSDIFL